MQQIVKGERKVISQYITVFQTILEFSIEKLGLEIVIKHNKTEPDNLMDNINDRLIKVCNEYLESHKLPLDKFQLATVVADLRSQAISSIDAPYRAIIKESKTLVQEYLDKNKSKREALERIRNENDSLDKEIEAYNKELKEKKKTLESNFVAQPEMPSEISEPGPMGPKPPTPKPKKKRAHWTDALAISDFKLPI